MAGEDGCLLTGVVSAEAKRQVLGTQEMPRGVAYLKGCSGSEDALDSF